MFDQVSPWTSVKVESASSFADSVVCRGIQLVLWFVLQEEELYACQRGCRLFSICQFVRDTEDLNQTKSECESSKLYTELVTCLILLCMVSGLCDMTPNPYNNLE